MITFSKVKEMPLGTKTYGAYSGNVFASIARVFAGNNTNLTMVENSAFATADRINIPPGDFSDPSYILKSLGFVVHEGRHHQYTDIELFGDVQKRCPMTASILNKIEDPWIERQQMDKNPGDAIRLHQLVKLCVDEGFFNPVDEKSPDSVIGGYLLYQLRYKKSGQTALKGLADHAEEAMHQVFPTNFVEKFDDIANRTEFATSTLENLELAEEIIQLIKDFKEEEEQDSSDDSSDASDNAEGGDEQDSSDDSSESSDNAEGGDEQDSSDDSSESSDNAEDDNEQDSNDDGSESSSDEDLESDPQTANDFMKTLRLAQLKSSVEEETAEFGEDVMELVADSISDDAINAPDHSKGLPPVMPEVKNPLPMKNQTQIDEMYRHVSSQCLSMRTKLVKYFEAQSRQNTALTDQGVRIANQALVRGFLNPNEAMFEVQSQPSKTMSTDVVILLDLSFSMENDISTVGEVGLGLSMTLERIKGVNVAVKGFPCVPLELRDKPYSYWSDPALETASIMAVKGFKDRTQKVAGNFHLTAHGVTPTGEAMTRAIIDLIGRKSDRKIIFMVTDGHPQQVPSLEAKLGNAYDNTLKARDISRQLGIELYGLQLGGDVVNEEDAFVSEFVDHHACIDSIEELKPAMFSLMSKALKSPKKSLKGAA